MPILLVNEIPFYEGPCLLSNWYTEQNWTITLNKNLADSILKREEDMKAAVFHIKQVLKVTMKTTVNSVKPFVKSPMRMLNCLHMLRTSTQERLREIVSGCC